MRKEDVFGQVISLETKAQYSDLLCGFDFEVSMTLALILS